jgi:hypothetical protein
MRFVIWIGLLLASRNAAADDFWSFWGDGKAELAGYALTQPRYGELRTGTAVLIFVTEDFSDTLRVKADPGKHPPSDVFPVLKLNFVRDFQTGIYDYNVMTSTFLRTEAAFSVAKISFSSQEWCGHVYLQWLAREGGLVGESHSYFDGEADARLQLPLPSGGVLEEQIPILIRDLRGDWLHPGESRTVPFLPSALRARLDHQPQKWGEATVRRIAAPIEVKTALGKLRAHTITVEEKGGPTTTWTVEEAAPHRLLVWTSTTGEAGRILGSARLPYWQMHQEGGEASLKLLGLLGPRPKDGGAKGPVSGPTRRKTSQ